MWITQETISTVWRSLLQNSKLNSQLRNPKHPIQVIHLEAEKHWVTISTIGCDEHTVIFDSSLSSVPLSVEQAILALLKPKCPVTVKVKNVIKLALQTVVWLIVLR